MNRPTAEHLVLDRLVHPSQLHVRAGTPLAGTDAARLVDLDIAHGVLAQPVPFVVGKPGRSDHRPRLVPGPETERQATAQLVAVLAEHAGEFHHARIACGVVSGLRSLPRILVAAYENELLGPR